MNSSSVAFEFYKRLLAFVISNKLFFSEVSSLNNMWENSRGLISLSPGIDTEKNVDFLRTQIRKGDVGLVREITKHCFMDLRVCISRTGVIDVINKWRELSGMDREVLAYTSTVSRYARGKAGKICLETDNLELLIEALLKVDGAHFLRLNEHILVDGTLA